MGLVDICKALKCVKAINLQCLPLTVYSWCQISHRNVLVQYIQHLDAGIHHYIMDFDSKYPKWCVWLTYANVWSVWKPLICNFFPWQLDSWCQISRRKSLVQYIQHLNAVMHHYIMDFESKYPKWWVWLTYAKVRSVWKPLICNFFPDSWLLMSDISHKKFWCNISSNLNTVMPSFYDGFWLKISTNDVFDSHLQPFEAWSKLFMCNF